MLRLPKFQLLQPRTLEEAGAMMQEHGSKALLLAGGTDLLPNMKHGLFEPEVVVALGNISDLGEIGVHSEGISIGAMTSLSAVAAHPELRSHAPVLAQAAGTVSGPQLRNQGTLGGNIMLDTRCKWYNQTYFWRQALGYCMKKDGTECHVVKGGSRCVAAASNDTAPALMVLNAQLNFLTQNGAETIPIRELYKADGIWNKKVSPTAILTEVHIPPSPPHAHMAYGKLRERGSIDFPLLGLAANFTVDSAGAIATADLATVALQARPSLLNKAENVLLGTHPGQEDFTLACQEVAQLASKQCRPLANIPGDEHWRQRMVPILVRRTLQAAADSTGPVSF